MYQQLASHACRGCLGGHARWSRGWRRKLGKSAGQLQVDGCARVGPDLLPTTWGGGGREVGVILSLCSVICGCSPSAPSQSWLHLRGRCSIFSPGLHLPYPPPSTPSRQGPRGELSARLRGGILGHWCHSDQGQSSGTAPSWYYVWTPAAGPQYPIGHQPVPGIHVVLL